jgi:hypothetical protein
MAVSNSNLKKPIFTGNQSPLYNKKYEDLNDESLLFSDRYEATKEDVNEEKNSLKTIEKE